MQLYLSMAIFAFTMSISPGAGNIVALTTGANYGYLKSIPFILGNISAFITLFLGINLGFGEANLQNNLIIQSMGYGGATFLIYIGYKIATSKPKIDVKQQEKQGFFQGAILQWLNPKSWIVSIASVSAFSLTGQTQQIIIFAIIFFVITGFSVSVWAFTGSKMMHLLQNPNHLNIFNRFMGSLLMLISFYLIYNLATGN